MPRYEEGLIQAGSRGSPFLTGFLMSVSHPASLWFPCPVFPS